MGPELHALQSMWGGGVQAAVAVVCKGCSAWSLSREGPFMCIPHVFRLFECAAAAVNGERVACGQRQEVGQGCKSKASRLLQFSLSIA
jgi:hypothetical protein